VEHVICVFLDTTFKLVAVLPSANELGCSTHFHCCCEQDRLVDAGWLPSLSIRQTCSSILVPLNFLLLLRARSQSLLWMDYQRYASSHIVYSSLTILRKVIVAGELCAMSRDFSSLCLGRANVGKSTLLNAILGRKDLVHTSKKAVRVLALSMTEAL
jgi:hypothetical protein